MLRSLEMRYRRRNCVHNMLLLCPTFSVHFTSINARYSSECFVLSRSNLCLFRFRNNSLSFSFAPHLDGYLSFLFLTFESSILVARATCFSSLSLLYALSPLRSFGLCSAAFVRSRSLPWAPRRAPPPPLFRLRGRRSVYADFSLCRVATRASRSFSPVSNRRGTSRRASLVRAFVRFRLVVRDTEIVLSSPTRLCFFFLEIRVKIVAATATW